MEEPLGQPSPSVGEFWVEGSVCQPYPTQVGTDAGILGEPGGQGCFDMLNRHLSPMSQGLRLDKSLL